jgi:hypothetical protein
MTMIDLLAFAVVAVALGMPCMVELLWGPLERPSNPRAAQPI